MLIKPTYSTDLKNIVRLCLKKNPNDRPSAKEIVELLKKAKPHDDIDAYKSSGD